MNPNKINREALVDFATVCATGVANGLATGFLAAQNTAFSDALTDANAILAAANLDASSALAAYSAAVHVAQDAQAAVLLIVQNIKDTMRGVNSPGDDYVALGYDMPVFVRGSIIPLTPTGLAAVGFSNGTNALNWVSHNVPGTVTFAIEAIIGDTAPYVLVGTTQQQKWLHVGVIPGEFYQYRVRAQAARGVVSAWSNTAVVYGVSGPIIP